MPIKDEDFEVIEETINDFEYFYEEDEMDKRNRKIIFKYKLISIAIISFIFVFLLTALGISRMKIYGTDNILTKEEMRYIEIKNECNEILRSAQAFYAYDSSTKNPDSTCSYYIMREALLNVDGENLTVEAFTNKVYGDNSVVGWLETFTSFSESLGEIIDSGNIPDRGNFEGYVTILTIYVNEEIELLNFLNNEFENISNGKVLLNSRETMLNQKYIELATIYNELNN